MAHVVSAVMFLVNVAASVDEILREIRDRIAVPLTRCRRLRNRHFTGVRPESWPLSGTQ
ncbi:hypothetical protein [Streptomyces sp. NPDC005930]|uniref:hypothetical protein n=1 Tax=Streptomyces sp. NPDC005930 TaxID=3364736 RepID=UPI0036ACA34A